MYTEFYGLKDFPFNMTSDPEYFFSSSRHMDAFSHLVYGVHQRKGIMVVTGEIGTGKTTLCRTLLSRMDNNVRTALILNPSFSEIQLLQLILKDLGIRGEHKNKLALIDALNAFLIEENELGRNVVIIIDEAQNLKPSQLEQIRLLSNIETEKYKLLQIILVGQPELLDKLKLPSLRQLNQRVAVRYHILPLEKEELRHYLSFRLTVARGENSGTQPVQFTDKAIDAIHLITKGTPRVINMLCDRALLAGFVQETFSIDEKIIYKCAREVT
ncbi:MAG TPA: AAA family ATPase [Candidatus Omnitrophota bacterium]|jgi:general secretion pathway protein A|nr:AAA family ATPase [Candidatus Omnitrophota bacterium]